MIIEAGRSEPKNDASVGSSKGIKGEGVIDTKTRTSHISWIPFKKMPDMYKDIEKIMKTTNGNHFGFDGMQITEMAQYTEYPEGGFYEWHVDNDVNCQHEPPVRKISMTCLLSPENEFEGGDLELMAEGKVAKIKQGHAVFFASFIRHRVKPVIRGNRKSLVMWFGGTPFK
jgi:PKHD-type hydroxylase